MSKAKIKPMSLKRLKELIEFWHGNDFHHEDFEMALAWIHAEARARMLEYIGRHYDCEDTCFFDESHIIFDGCGELPYFIAAVKREVGWPED